MPYFSNKKLLFVHFPRTAGRSIIKCLGDHELPLENNRPGSTHQNIQQYWSIINPEDKPKIKSFTVIRKTEDRLESAWRYLSEIGIGIDEHQSDLGKGKMAFSDLWKCTSFNDFVLHTDFVRYCQSSYGQLFQPLLFSLIVPFGQSCPREEMIPLRFKSKFDIFIPDFILDYDTLSPDFDRLKTKLGLSSDLSLLHFGKTALGKEDLLGIDAKQKINELYKTDQIIIQYLKAQNLL